MNTNPNPATHNQSNKEFLRANEEETAIDSTGTDVGAVKSNPTPFTDNQKVEARLAALGETMGDFKAYDSQLPIVDIEGTRIVKCLYQAGKDKAGKALPKKHNNTYVRVNCKHLTEDMILERISELTPYILSYLQGIEDGMVKEYHKSGLLRITEGNLSMNKIINKLEESETSARLSKDKIEAWFDECLEDSLTTAIAAKMKLGDDCSESELMKLECVLEAYKAKFSSLANPKVYIVESDCVAMVAVIMSADADSSLLGNRFIVRLESMKQKQDDLLMSF